MHEAAKNIPVAQKRDKEKKQHIVTGKSSVVEPAVLRSRSRYFLVGAGAGVKM